MKKSFLVLSFAIPDEEMKADLNIDKFPAIQTHKFIWNLIKGLESYDTFRYVYISARPVSDFPDFAKKRIKSNNWNIDFMKKKIEITEIPFLNSSILKTITRFLSGIYYCCKKFHKEKNKSGVIVYSVHVPFMIIGYIVSRIYGIGFIAVWTDPPSVSNERESLFKSRLRRIELTISKFLMKKTTKVIALTKYLAEDFAPKTPYLVIEGIIDEEEINQNLVKDRMESSDFTKIVYTGSLEKKYGIKNIVESFNLIKENIILEIYGRGNYEEELKEVTLKNEKVRYKGYLANNEILNIQREADFLINARSANDEYVKYSFPSKTLEYMLSGTPLITTMLPGIPEEYRDYILVLKDNLPETIYEMLKEVQEMSEDDRLKIGVQAQNFARSKSYIHQGKCITDFLNL